MIHYTDLFHSEVLYNGNVLVMFGLATHKKPSLYNTYSRSSSSITLTVHNSFITGTHSLPAIYARAPLEGYLSEGKTSKSTHASYFITNTHIHTVCSSLVRSS